MVSFEKNEIFHLIFVFLFDSNFLHRQWLPRNKIALLGKDREFDSQKKNEGKTAALRKSVQKAYSRATQQAQNI